MDAGVDLGEDAVLDEVVEAGRQDVLGDAEVGLEVGEAARAEEGFAHDEQGPPVAQHLEGAGDRAVLAAEPRSHQKMVA